MPQLTSADRTSIAYEQTGHGPAVVLVHVGPFTQALNAGLAGLLAGMRDAPFWAGMEAEAHGLIADHALVGDLTFPPAGQLRAIEVPTLVLDGGPASPLAASAVQVARCVPGACHQSLDGQPHNVDDGVMAAALTEFFG